MNLWKRILRCLWPSLTTQWDMAAGAMRVDGYTETDIELALGPRPNDQDRGSSAAQEG